MGCLWMLMLLIAEIFATEFIPVSRCPDVSSDTSLEQASGFVCSDSTDTNYKLHCILEEDNYKLGLVCTRWAWMETNTCPIFSISWNEIDYFPCSGNDTLCPRVSEYKSFEAYKFPGCLIGKDMLTTTKETTQPTPTTKIKSESPDLPAYVYVLITICVVSVILNIILIVIFRKPITRWLKKHTFHDVTERKTAFYGHNVNRLSEEITPERDPVIVCVGQHECDTYERENTNKHKEYKSETDDDSRSQEKVPLKDSQAECRDDRNVEAKVIDIGRIKEENEMLRRWLYCTICKEKEKNMLCQDCGHISICESCSSSVQTCNMCGKSAKERMKIFFS